MSYPVAFGSSDDELRNFSSRESAFWYLHREGFIVGRLECRICGNSQDTFIDPRYPPPEFTACPECGSRDARFVQETPTASK